MNFSSCSSDADDTLIYLNLETITDSSSVDLAVWPNNEYIVFHLWVYMCDLLLL